jgi:prolyl-tRNA editing enzyme YbaK/EbsC (Cys-tRNA(Pro) deacylase)
VSGEGLPDSAQRVQQALSRAGLDRRVRLFPNSTRSSAEAAAAVGCSVAQIAKSIVFRAEPSGRAVLAIASGANRIDEAKLARGLGERMGKANAHFVREQTGFAIGGVPPLPLADGVVLIDADLLHFEEIWAAAGTPFAVVPLAPAELLALSRGTVADIKQA